MWRLRFAYFFGAIPKSWRGNTTMNERVAVAVVMAPIAGFARHGSSGARADGTRYRTRLTERAVATATAAAVGPVTVWAIPDESPGQALAASFDVASLAKTAISEPHAARSRAANPASSSHRLPGADNHSPAQAPTSCAKGAVPSSFRRTTGLCADRCRRSHLCLICVGAYPMSWTRRVDVCGSLVSLAGAVTLWDVDVPWIRTAARDRLARFHPSQ
jgi:hypothetical protein